MSLAQRSAAELDATTPDSARRHSFQRALRGFGMARLKMPNVGVNFKRRSMSEPVASDVELSSTPVVGTAPRDVELSSTPVVPVGLGLGLGLGLGGKGGLGSPGPLLENIEEVGEGTLGSGSGSGSGGGGSGNVESGGGSKRASRNGWRERDSRDAKGGRQRGDGSLADSLAGWGLYDVDVQLADSDADITDVPRPRSGPGGHRFRASR